MTAQALAQDDVDGYPVRLTRLHEEIDLLEEQLAAATARLRLLREQAEVIANAARRQRPGPSGTPAAKPEPPRAAATAPAADDPDPLHALRSLLAEDPRLVALCDRLFAEPCAEQRTSVLRLVTPGSPSPPVTRPRTGVHAPHPDLQVALCPEELRSAAAAGASILGDAAFLFCTELRALGLSTSQRVSPFEGTSLSNLYGALQRRLALQRTMLLVRPGRAIGVVPTIPPTVVCGSEVAEDALTRFRLARALASTAPEHLLWSALPLDASREAYDAIAWAFGTPTESPLLAHAGRLGREYQRLPIRTQRDLRRRLEEGTLPPFETVRRLGGLALHRAALVATGDLGAALMVVAAEEPSLAGVELRVPAGLAALLQRSDLARDLVRFSVSDAYPQLRSGSPSGPSRKVSRLDERPRPVLRPATSPGNARRR